MCVPTHRSLLPYLGLTLSYRLGKKRYNSDLAKFCPTEAVLVMKNFFSLIGTKMMVF